VRFEIDDTFATSRAELEALLDEPDLYPRMARELPNIERIELLESEERDGVVRRLVRYTPRGAAERIPALARGRITPEMMVWLEESRFIRREHRLEYRVEPNIPVQWKDQFTSQGEFTFSEVGNGVARKIAGEVVVRVPMVGALVERHLIKDLRASFRAEAAILTAWLAERQAARSR
jgi:hypothetical protein